MIDKGPPAGPSPSKCQPDGFDFRQRGRVFRSSETFSFATALEPALNELFPASPFDNLPELGLLHTRSRSRVNTKSSSRSGSSPSKPRLMTPEQILRALTRVDLYDGPLPKRALNHASRRREEMLPLFLKEVETFVAASPKKRNEATPVLFIFFLLGERGDKSAYRSLARLIRCPEFSDRPGLESVFDETGHRVMAAVFDGDPAPLYEVALDPEADRIARHNTFASTLRMLAHDGRIDREALANFLVDAYDQLDDQPNVWRGWATLAAHLNLIALRPLVIQALNEERLEDYDLEEFDEELEAAASRAASSQIDDDFSPFGDAYSELEGHFSEE